MQVSVLGPVEVRADGRVIAVAGNRVRRLLVRLAVDAPRSVSATELVDAVWYDGEPQAVANALQALVSRVRRLLGGPDVIQQTPSGYRLVGCETDLDLFERLAADGRACLAKGDLDAAARLLREAEAIWSGPALVDAGGADYAIGLVARLQERRLEVIGDRIDADLGRGEAAAVVAELEELTADLPLRERLAGQLMRALAATGRPAEALACYARLRERLAEELGADPSRELQEIHLELLRGESSAAGARPSDGMPMRMPLRASLTTFVGRADELKRVHELLDGGRLVTIVGPGGAGKTRLSVEAAQSWPAPEPWSGSWLVELAPVTDPHNIATAMLSTLGIRELRHSDDLTEVPVSRDAPTRLAAALRDLGCLIVVDNCEHLLDGVAALVDRLLRECPRLRILATSREPIGLDGEAICAVPPLGLPPPEADPDEAMRYPAVQLLSDRAFAATADFAVDRATVSDVVEIVRRLDGLPLAIELAAARLRVLPVDEVARRLTDRFRLLSGGSRTAVPRHRTLRAVVEWSWDLLADPERALVERLAVFPAGISIDAARDAGSGEGLDHTLDRDSVPELLDALVDKSLLYVTDGHPLRYRMLETIREYGLERLGDRGEIEAVRGRFAEYFRGLAWQAADRLHTSDQLEAFHTVVREWENLVAALGFLGESGEVDAAIGLAIDLSWYLVLRNEHEEAHRILSFVTGLPEAEKCDLWPIAEAGRLLNRLAVQDDEIDLEAVPAMLAAAARRLRDTPAADPHFRPMSGLLQAGLALMSRDEQLISTTIEEALLSSDPWLRGAARAMRAAIAENQGRVDVMRENADEAVAAFRSIGDRWGLATALGSQGYVLQMEGDLAGAVDRYSEAASLLQDLGAEADSSFIGLRIAGLRTRQERYDEARLLVEGILDRSGARDEELGHFARATLAHLCWLAGDLERARALREECREALDRTSARGLAAGHGRAVARASVAALDLADGNIAQAAFDLPEAHQTALLTRDGPVVAFVGLVVADLADRLGRPELAVEMAGAAAVLRGGDDPTDPVVMRLTERLRPQLGGAAFELAYRRGRSISWEDALRAVDPARLDSDH